MFIKMTNLVNNINKMFIDIKEIINPGAYFIGCFIPLEQDYQIMRDKMPKFIFLFIYPIHFIIYRICPKLPIIKYLYSFLTKGEGRLISKSEVFGRLNYCGFKIIDSVLIKNQIFFICRNIKTKSLEENPSYGPIVKLKRIGYEGELITIFKIRTMHPYSEFLQKDLIREMGLNNDGDKITEDYRITSYGKILRRFWIDELPQIINWLRGDLSLVGVRALSKVKFDMYPKELKDLRTRFKPGLVPPFYVDMPNSFDELLDSEDRYLKNKIANRFRTDVVYFFRAINNILIKGARSR